MSLLFAEFSGSTGSDRNCRPWGFVELSTWRFRSVLLMFVSSPNADNLLRWQELSVAVTGLSGPRCGSWPPDFHMYNDVDVLRVGDLLN